MSNNSFLLIIGEFQYFLQLFQGIIQKKSVSRSRTLLLVICDKTVLFFQKIVLFYGISWKNYAKSDFRRCLKILDYTLFPQYKNALSSQKALPSQKSIFLKFISPRK